MVVGIIALLVTILMPSLGRALELTRKTICQTNLNAMGRAWHIYWIDYENKHPRMILGHRPGTALDSISQYNDVICGSWKNITGAGHLFKYKYIEADGLYVCPTVRRSVGGEWWQKVNVWDPNFGGPWPLEQTGESRTTYGIRRMGQYDDPALADADSWSTSDPRTNDLMLMKCGVGGIKQPSDFSLMADCFRSPRFALRSHVPKINVLWLDSHVTDFSDDTEDGEILYGGNGITSTYNDNWLHDDIWMIIDGYHRPPVGQ